MITIYHNNSCSKSRTALRALTESGKPFEIVEYLNDTPSIAALKEIVQKLGCAPRDLIRTNEAIYLEKYKGKTLTDEEWIIAMHENPILIQRPIIVDGEKATIARSDDVIRDVI